jgi:ammonium transporter, Amt family
VPTQIFPDQVTTDVYVMEMFYIIATAGSMAAILAIALMDAGLAQPKNLIDTFVQKLLCALIGGLAFMFFGYAVWNWQFYRAFGIPDAFTASVKDWGLLGNNMMILGPRLDPAAVAAQAGVCAPRAHRGLHLLHRTLRHRAALAGARHFARGPVHPARRC